MVGLSTYAARSYPASDALLSSCLGMLTVVLQFTSWALLSQGLVRPRALLCAWTMELRFASVEYNIVEDERIWTDKRFISCDVVVMYDADCQVHFVCVCVLLSVS